VPAPSKSTSEIAVVSRQNSEGVLFAMGHCLIANSAQCLYFHLRGLELAAQSGDIKLNSVLACVLFKAEKLVKQFRLVETFCA
jgi:hypothetical protein